MMQLVNLDLKNKFKQYDTRLFTRIPRQRFD